MAIRDRQIIINEIKNSGPWYRKNLFDIHDSSAEAEHPSWDGTNLGYIFEHNPGANQELQLICHIESNWVEGTPLVVHMTWCLLADDGAANEDVKWDVLYRWYDIGEVTNGAFTTLETTVDVSSFTQWTSVLTSLGSIPGTGKTINSVVEVRLQRDTADAADDHPHNVLFKSIDFITQTDQIGSLFSQGKWSNVTL